MVMKSGSVEDVCEQSRKLAAAALQAKSPEYDSLATGASINCMTAHYHPGESYDQATNMSAAVMEPDNMDMMPDNTNDAAGGPPAKAKTEARPPEEIAEVEPAPVAASQPAPAMCLKDYCPCDQPQDGPDSVLCDQLEQGIPVDQQMMIAGRGMREGRRQLRALDQ